MPDTIRGEIPENRWEGRAEVEENKVGKAGRGEGGLTRTKQRSLGYLPGSAVDKYLA